jgi:hypothetical protein
VVAAGAVIAAEPQLTGGFTGAGRDDLFAYVPGVAADRLRPGTSSGMG